MQFNEFKLVQIKIKSDHTSLLNFFLLIVHEFNLLNNFKATGFLSFFK